MPASSMSFGGGGPDRPDVNAVDQAILRASYPHQNNQNQRLLGSQPNLPHHDSTDALMSQLQSQGLDAMAKSNNNFMSSLVDEQLDGNILQLGNEVYAGNAFPSQQHLNTYGQPNQNYER